MEVPRIVIEAVGAAVGAAVVSIPLVITAWLRYVRPWLKATLEPVSAKVTNIDNAVNHGRMERMEVRVNRIEDAIHEHRQETTRQFGLISEQFQFVLSAIKGSD